MDFRIFAPPRQNIDSTDLNFGMGPSMVLSFNFKFPNFGYPILGFRIFSDFQVFRQPIKVINI